MKAEGKAKWFIDALMEFILDKDEVLAENKEFSSQLKDFAKQFTSSASPKKVKARKPRTPKALPYDGIIGKPNGADTEEHAN